MDQWWLRKAGLLWVQWAVKSLRYPTWLDFLHPVKYLETGCLATGWAIETHFWLYLQNLCTGRGRWQLRLQGKGLTQPVCRYFMHVFTLTAAICWVYSLFLSLFSMSNRVSSWGNRNLEHTCLEYLPDLGTWDKPVVYFQVYLYYVWNWGKYKQKSWLVASDLSSYTSLHGASDACVNTQVQCLLSPQGVSQWPPSDLVCRCWLLRPSLDYLRKGRTWSKGGVEALYGELSIKTLSPVPMDSQE